MKRAWLLALMLLGGGAQAVSSGPAEPARAWLVLLDAGDAAAAWAAAGKLFQARLTEPRWAELAAEVRGPLGEVTSRRIKDAKSTTTLPGAPDGHYEVVRFATSFANKARAIETIVLADENGAWKVDGYFIT